MNKKLTFFKIQVKRRTLLLFFLLACFFYTSCHLYNASTTKGANHNINRLWSVYKADAESSSYSELKQINVKNVNQLQLAWTFSPNETGGRSGSSESNPIIVDGIMYTVSAKHHIYAVNANNGQQIWSFDPFDGGKRGGEGGVGRGVTYWEDGEDKRILFTGGDNLFAVNALTGKLISSFGDQGRVSMNVGMRGDSSKISVIPTSPGIVYQDLLIMGTEVSELYGAEPGYIRAYNIRTGKLTWTFHTIPWPGEAGYETWPKDAWKYVGGVNNWGGMSIDTKRGVVYMSLGSPTYDYYGADRKGQGLYGNCVLALDAKTGKHVWHFQTIHHDLWDYDLPAPPNLVTVMKDGKKIDAVAQISKVGFLYVLNRETGESLFPVEERKVPVSNIPGEYSSPTQPFPLKPAPFARQFMTKDDLTNFTPAAHDSILKRFNSMRYEGLFTPPDTRGTLILPGSRGGAEWGGAAFDPASGVIYIRSNDSPEIITMKKMEVAKETATESAYNQGKSLYLTYCVSCHGADRNGDEQNYPSLVALQTKLQPEAALAKIRQGGGKMPGFASVIKGHEEEILAYLYERKDSKVKQGSRSGRANTDTGYINTTAYSHFNGPDRNPALKAPWGTLNAINLNTGEYEWKIPVGNTPNLQEKGGPETGSEGSAGPIVTGGGLVFIGGFRDRMFRAYDKASGKLVWETQLPGVANATACTYISGGKQYVAVSVGGDSKNPAGTVMAFSLPNK